MHVDEDERGTLALGEPGESLLDVEAHLGGGVVVVPVGELVLGQLGRRPAAAQPVETGVDDDAVQPGRDGRLAAEGVGAAEGGDEAVLDAVGGELGIADGAQGDGPHPVLVPAEELGEGMVVAVDVQCQQLPVAQVGDRGGIPRAHGQRTVTSLICAR